MLATKSNTADKGCSPVSSNCVIWQGPNLSCINLCNGDTISDVTYKIATALCTIQTAYDLTNLDLSCLTTFCTNVTGPSSRSLPAVLEFIVQKICCIEGQIVSPQDNTTYTEPYLTLPTCLQYTNAQGQTVTSLIHNQFTLTMATKVCSLSATVSTHSSQITTLQSQVAALQAAGGYTLPTMVPKCVLPSIATPIDQVLVAVETQFCNLVTTLGSNALLTAASAQQCAGLASAPALSSTGTMSSLTGWNSTVTNVAQSLQNLWITVCDIRSAVSTLSASNGAVNCSQFILGFTAATNSDRSQVTLFFNANTTIPSGFANCNQQGSVVTITDGQGHTYTGYVDLIAASTNSGGVTFTVSSASLNTSQPYTVTVNGCISKNGQTCSKTATYTVSVPCPVVSGVSATLI